MHVNNSHVCFVQDCRVLGNFKLKTRKKILVLWKNLKLLRRVARSFLPVVANVMLNEFYSGQFVTFKQWAVFFTILPASWTSRHVRLSGNLSFVSNSRVFCADGSWIDPRGVKSLPPLTVPSSAVSANSSRKSQQETNYSHFIPIKSSQDIILQRNSWLKGDKYPTQTEVIPQQLQRGKICVLTMRLNHYKKHICFYSNNLPNYFSLNNSLSIPAGAASMHHRSQPYRFLKTVNWY